MRELSTTQFIAVQHTDVNLLYRTGLLTPVELKQNLTYLYGKDSEMFPLLTMTEGNGAIVSKKPLKLNDTQYTWKVFVVPDIHPELYVFMIPLLILVLVVLSSGWLWKITFSM